MNDQQTSTPTTECVFRLFQHVGAVLIRHNDIILERRVHGFSDLADKALRLLSISPEIYWTPRRKSWGSA